MVDRRFVGWVTGKGENKTIEVTPTQTEKVLVTNTLPTNISTMAPRRKVVKKVKPVLKVKKATTKRRGSRVPAFGPVSTIDTAPVSIGNTVSGAAPIAMPFEDGMRLRGRDYLVDIDSTSTNITDWTLVAGCPISPMAMVASALKGYATTYAHFCVHGVALHYITASSTGNTGSIMFYFNRDRLGPALPTDSSNFMPAVLSDRHTLIGPLWKNNTASYFPESRWYPTDVMNNEDLNDQCPGEVLIYTKTISDEVPGYVLVDYDISFRGMSVNPKTLALPVSRMKYNQMVLYQPSGTDFTQGQPNQFIVDQSTFMGGTSAAIPSGAVAGDIYKIILNLNDVDLGLFTPSTLLRRQGPLSIDFATTLTDGFTCFGMLVSTSIVVLYPTFEAAVSGASSLFEWAATHAATHVKIYAYASLVGTYAGALMQANI